MDAESSSLGKRKERDGDVVENKAHGSTIFVSNLPYTATSTDLKTLFSDLGPVRSAFVVTEHGTGVSKGVGYVSFSIKEDAQLAFEKVNDSIDDLILDGRRLRAQWAENKPHKERNVKDVTIKDESKPAKLPRVTQPAGPRDPNAIRTIVVSGLPGSIDSKSLWKKVRKYDGAEKVEWPIQVDGVEDKSTAHVLFTNPSTAQEAVNKLHAHVFKGSLLSVTLKKRLDGLAKASQQKTSSKRTVIAQASSSATTVPHGAAPSRANRLIVRNLPWDITEQDLRSVFLPYGPIYSIHIPTSISQSTDAVKLEEETEAKPKHQAKGYAFVWMLSRKDAEKAIESTNGTRVRAGMAEMMVRDKQKKKKLRREEAKIRQKEKERKAKKLGEKVKEEDGDDEEGEGESEDEEEGNDGDENADETSGFGEREIAVDWALSKDKWEEAKAKMLEDAEEEDAEGEGSSGSDDDEESGDDSHIGVHEGHDSDSEEGSDSSDDGNDDSMDVDEEAIKPKLPDTETGNTLFVRNIPFEATEDELRTTFRAFGPLRYARITLEHDTGRSRGTGFVCYWQKEDADKAIAQSDILRQETTGTGVSLPKKNPFKLPSLLTPDPSASLAQNLVLHGRTLDVIRAVTRDEAGKLKEAGERAREKADKRNLYLLREGIILPNTPAAESLTSTEVEKRTQSFNARRALLRSNPSLFVSRTRLSVRQLPVFVTERMLKRLAIHAVKAFNAEVKAGKRTALTLDELTEPIREDDEDEPEKSKNKMKGKQGRNTGVKQAKIVRQQDRVDPVTGKGRSRGYGFLEMGKHADALRVLRWANNNPEVGKLFGEWWKEELEDMVKAEKAAKKDDGRLERLKKELDEGTLQQKKTSSKGTLILEFSIENIQVVKRRAAVQQEQKVGSSDIKKGRRAPALNVKTEPDTEEHRKKKRRTSDVELKSKKGGDTESKEKNNIGSLIGRKRKEKRKKRG
ncbi:hypothetical protein C8Q75DRAFT_873532 [Abortiporus biennis]|nr:hypothetical protein C8Q75DRAFT_873532 [Abortiporus biennis]